MHGTPEREDRRYKKREGRELRVDTNMGDVGACQGKGARGESSMVSGWRKFQDA